MWELLVAGLLSLAGVTLGGWMSRHSAADALEKQLREERRQSVHRLLAELIADMRTKIDLAWIMIPAMAKMTTDDLTEYVDSESGIEARAREARLNRNVVELALLIGDQSLRVALGELSQCITDWPEKASGPVTATAVAGKGDIDAIRKGFEHVSATQRALNAVQTEANALLPVQLEVRRQPSLARRGLARLRINSPG